MISSDSSRIRIERGGPGCVWRDHHGEFVSAEVYHGDDTALGHTMFEDFLRSPAMFANVYVSHTQAKKAPTDDMILGNAIHTALLEPEHFEARYMVPPEVQSDGKKWHRGSNPGKADWAFLKEAAGACGKILLEPGQAPLCHKLAAAVRANPMGKRLLSDPGPIEEPLVWIDQETGLVLKARRDKVLQHMTVDIKTKFDDVGPYAFARRVDDLGYHRTAAWYTDADEACCGLRRPHVFLAVSKGTFECGFYELDADALQLGRRQNRIGLRRLAQCMESGVWLAPHERKIVRLSMPRYAYTKEGWEIEP